MVSKQPLRILVVEDNDPTRFLIRGILEGAGIEVLEARDGATALALASLLDGPDLAVLDLNLPDREGLEVARQFERRLPFLVLTVDDDPQTLQASIRQGALGYLVKPPQPETLLRQVYVAVERGRDTRNLSRAVQETQVISRAIGLLMAYHTLSEKAASQRLIDQAVAQQCRVQELAAAVVQAHHSLVHATEGRRVAGTEVQAARKLLARYGDADRTRSASKARP